MVAGLVGRRDEIARVTTVLRDVVGGGAGKVVVVRGEPGIGKSALLSATRAAATGLGYRVWRAAPTAAEQGLPWAGLAHLYAGLSAADRDGVVAAHAERLAVAAASAQPAAQPDTRSADIAPDSEAAAHESVDIAPETVAFALAAALDVFRHHGEQSVPLLVEIDDLQWLDGVTAGALAYALRNTARRRVVVLLAARSADAIPLEPNRLVDADTLIELRLEGLGPAELRDLIANEFGDVPTREQLAHIERQSGGNPLYAIEIAKASTWSAPAALPSSLRDSLFTRVRALPETTQQLLAVAAMSSRPTVALLARVFPGTEVLELVAAAELAGIATVGTVGSFAEVRVVFAHPLLASAAVESQPVARQRALRRALADATDDVVERACHLARLGSDAGSGGNGDDAGDEGDAGDGDDQEEIARQLADAAAEARRRGATDLAVELAQAALALTPVAAVVELLERRRVLAEYHNAAGDWSAALVDIQRVLAELETPPAVIIDSSTRQRLREQALHDLVPVLSRTDGYRAALVAAKAALEVVTDPSLLAVERAWRIRLEMHLDLRRAAELVREFRDERAAVGEREPALDLDVLSAAAVLGEPVDADAAIVLYRELAAEGPDWPATATVTDILGWHEDGRCLVIIDEMLAVARGTGSVAQECNYLRSAARLHFLRGDWRGAEAAVQRVIELTMENTEVAEARATLALILAGRGDAAGALEQWERGCFGIGPEFTSTADKLWGAILRAELSFVLTGAPAADELAAATTGMVDFGARGMPALPARRDLVEALVDSGRIAEANAVADELIADARHSEVPAALAVAASAAGCIAAAYGDFVAAREHYRDAAERYGQLGLRYYLARTLLTAGQVARRAGERDEAAERLGRARALFAEMDAFAWIERCDAELSQLGVGSAEDTDLTTAEERIAKLVLAGMSNREIAAAVYLSVRTVEANLTRIYRKLDVRSRAELAGRLATAPTRSA